MRRPEKIVDVDVHHCYEESEDLVPYLPDKFVNKFLGDDGVSIGGRQYGNNGGFQGIMGELRDESDNDPMMITAGALIDDVQNRLLDEYDINIALLTGFGTFLSASSYPDREYGTALCRAFNQYTIENWLDVDNRFRYSLMVNHSDPESAAEEIRRLGDHPQIIGVMMAPSATYPFGNSVYDPIYEAAIEHDLTVTCHLGGGGGIHSYPPTAAGHPTHYIESRMSRHPNIQAHLASLVFQGTFERYPELRFVSLEWGWSWIPSFLWRMDHLWEENKADYPELKQAPSEYIRDHVRFNTQPVEEPETNEQLRQLLELMNGDELLLYASDFPHWDFDNPDRTLTTVSPEIRQQIFADNASQVFTL